MDKVAIVFLSGAASVLALSAASAAPAQAPNLTASSFEDLLQPIPQATQALRAVDLAQPAMSGATSESGVIPVQYHHHHGFAHHHHHHHHHHGFFGFPVPFVGPHCVYRRTWVWGPYGRHLVVRRVCY